MNTATRPQVFDGRVNLAVYENTPSPFSYKVVTENGERIKWHSLPLCKHFCGLINTGYQVV